MGEKKNPQLDFPSPESSLTQGDSDSESTSVSSSVQNSTSSATSSLDQESTNVKGATKTKKVLKKSNSKKLGSSLSSRRRAQSRLSQSSIKLSDDGSSTTPPHPSSLELSDESSNNYVQKSTPKFTRTGSLRSVKIFRSKSKNKLSFKSNKSSKSIDTCSEISEESHFPMPTFSSILKDSKFPEHLKHQPGPSDPEEVLEVAKFCPYQHCSLHGHHHHHEPPQKRFPYLKRRTTNDQTTLKKSENQSTDKKPGKKREPKINTRVSDGKIDHDFSIEFYAKTRYEPVENHGFHDSEMADILFGVNSLHEKKNETPMLENRDFSNLNEKDDGNIDGSKSVTEKKPALKKANQMSMWQMIHRHMVSGLESETGDKIVLRVEEEKKSSTTTKKYDDAASQEMESRKMHAIKLVRDAIEKILLPEVQDDQSTTNEVVPEKDISENNQIEGQTISDKKEETRETPATGTAETVETKTVKQAPNSWSRLKKVFLLRKFVKELEKVKKFNPKKPTHLPLPPQSEPETVSLRRQKTGDKKNADEWMLDYALQKVVGELAPTQKRKVALLVKAFETVAPAQDDQPESQSNAELQRVGSETERKFQNIIELKKVDSTADFEMKSAPNVISRSNSDIESTIEVDNEKRIKMWHMIYQHVVTDIATKLGSDLLLDGDDSTNSEEKNLLEVEDHTERSYRLAFTQSDAVKLVRESVDEILLPDVPDTPDTSSQVSDQEELPEKKEDDEGESKIAENDSVTDEIKKPAIEGTSLGFASRLQNQSSKNWSKLKKLILVRRSIKALEGFRKLKPQTLHREVTSSDPEKEKVDLRRQMMDERKKAEQWMLDYAVQHIVTKLTPARKKRVSMLVEAFEAVVPLPEI